MKSGLAACDDASFLLLLVMVAVSDPEMVSVPDQWRLSLA